MNIPFCHSRPCSIGVTRISHTSHVSRPHPPPVLRLDLNGFQRIIYGEMQRLVCTQYTGDLTSKAGVELKL